LAAWSSGSVSAGRVADREIESRKLTFANFIRNLCSRHIRKFCIFKYFPKVCN
jgi:hypothetical protein